MRDWVNDKEMRKSLEEITGTSLKGRLTPEEIEKIADRIYSLENRVDELVSACIKKGENIVALEHEIGCSLS